MSFHTEFSQQIASFRWIIRAAAFYWPLQLSTYCKSFKRTWGFSPKQACWYEFENTVEIDRQGTGTKLCHVPTVIHFYHFSWFANKEKHCFYRCWQLGVFTRVTTWWITKLPTLAFLYLQCSCYLSSPNLWPLEEVINRATHLAFPNSGGGFKEGLGGVGKKGKWKWVKSR